MSGLIEPADSLDTQSVSVAPRSDDRPVHGGLWQNLASLYGVHIASYVIPLFTLPYLARGVQSCPMIGPRSIFGKIRFRLKFMSIRGFPFD